MIYFMGNLRFRNLRMDVLKMLARCVQTAARNLPYDQSDADPVRMRFASPKLIAAHHLSDMPESGTVYEVRAPPPTLSDDSEQLTIPLILPSTAEMLSESLSGPPADGSATVLLSSPEPGSEESSSSFFDAVSEPSEEFKSPPPSESASPVSDVSEDAAKRPPIIGDDIGDELSVSSIFEDISEVSSSSVSSRSSRREMAAMLSSASTHGSERRGSGIGIHAVRGASEPSDNRPKRRHRAHGGAGK
jgi:hypothetical protein